MNEKNLEILKNLETLEGLELPKSNKRESNDITIYEYFKSKTIFKPTSNVLALKYNQQINYNFKTKNNLLLKKIFNLLLYSFYSMNSIISKPVFEITSEKLIIHLFFYLFKKNKNNERFIIINKNKLNILCKILSKIFNKPVELDLVRLYYPYFDSYILTNIFNKVVNKLKVRNIIQKFLKKAIIINPINFNKFSINNKFPSFISGIKIKVAGRLLTDAVIPRKTVLTIRKGTLSRNKINFLDIAKYTSKNKRGAYSLTITTGQILK
jgi:hypothetical protein